MNKFKGENTSYMINNEIDYTQNKSLEIDSRILKICSEAESNFMQNKNTVDEIKRMKSSTVYNDSKKQNYTQQEKIKNYVPVTQRSLNFKDNPIIKSDSQLLMRTNGLEKSVSKTFNGKTGNYLSYSSGFKMTHKHSDGKKKCIACDLKNK